MDLVSRTSGSILQACEASLGFWEDGTAALGGPRNQLTRRPESLKRRNTVAQAIPVR